MHVETYLNVDISSSAQAKIPVKIQIWTYLKKSVGFHVVVLMNIFLFMYKLLMWNDIDEAKDI